MKTLQNFFSFIQRHLAVLWFVISVLVPTIIHTGKRPVLFVRLAGIGDILCTFPATFELMKRHPGAVFFYNCLKNFECLPHMAGLNAHTFTTPHGGLIKFWYRWLLSGFYQFDYIDENPEICSNEILIKEFASVYGVEVDGHHPSLKVPASITAKVQKLLISQGINAGEKFIAIHPGPSWPVREWPGASWVELIKRLHQSGIQHIVQLGVSKGFYLGEDKAPKIPGVVNLVNGLTLEETVALISMAALFVGIDSGLLHVAACVKTPSVGLWGPTLPLLRFSADSDQVFVSSQVPCLGCHHRLPRLHWITNCSYNIRCMKEITAAEVFGICLHKLNSPSQF